MIQTGQPGGKSLGPRQDFETTLMRVLLAGLKHKKSRRPPWCGQGSRDHTDVGKATLTWTRLRDHHDTDRSAWGEEPGIKARLGDRVLLAGLKHKNQSSVLPLHAQIH